MSCRYVIAILDRMIIVILMIIRPIDDIIGMFDGFIVINRVIHCLVMIMIVFSLLFFYNRRVSFLSVTHNMSHFSLLTYIITHRNCLIVVSYLMKSIPILGIVNSVTAAVQIHEPIRYKNRTYCLSKCLMDCLS